MTDLADGESVEMQGSAAKPYILKNTGGVYSCSCPAWRNQSLPIEKRTCKHLKKLRGEDAERARVGAAVARAPRAQKSGSSSSSSKASAPPVLLAQSWDNEADLTGWWMSEKLDGVRAYWDGTQFVSRLGNRYIAPDWFVAELPSTPLDGELWVGRKQFQKTVSIVRRSDAGTMWQEVKYLVFDAPSQSGAFEERIAHLEAHFGANPATHAEVVKHEECRGLEHLTSELARIEGLGGEGLMLRKPGSHYHAGRSSTLLKVKSFHDAEAKVIGHTAGAGRHKGRLGALRVITPGGIEFSVGTGLSDAEREDPPGVGCIITYRYQELSKDSVPRFPSYVGIRHDFAWPESAPESSSQPAAATVRRSRPAASASSAPVSAPASAPVVPTTASGTGDTRYFELIDEKSSKFWEITVDGSSHSARYGRIGSQGTTTIKQFATPAAARADADKRVTAKTRKGYTEKPRSE